MIDALILSRIQFATNISFHILFPSITIALCWYLLYFKLRFEHTGDEIWMRAYRFWVKIFALTFAMGVVTGVTMAFQFGTNWPGYMETVGNIAGPLLGYEVMTAFFLEATFLGVMLFGINRVSQRMHTVATLLVAIGTTASGFWILALNSWMQTPVGFEMRAGVAFPVDWMEIIFNPSFPLRFTHMMLASGLTASFFIVGISAYRLLRNDPKRGPHLVLKTAITVAALLIPIQMFVGDSQGRNTLKYQPQKIAAIEAIWETGREVPLLLFALPDEKEQKNYFEIGLPKMGSMILTHSFDGELRGIKSFGEDHPPVTPLFFSFRIMVGMAVLMLMLAWYGAWKVWCRATLSPLFLKACVAMTFSGWIATLAGWYTTEIGRQPWLVTGVLRTADAVTTLPPANILSSLLLYLLIYLILGYAYIHTIFLLARRAAKIEIQDLDTNSKGPDSTSPVSG